jgi:phosphoserine phosphatase
VLKLETLGWKVAIASGGFTFFAEYLRDKLHLTRWWPTSWRSWTVS